MTPLLLRRFMRIVEGPHDDAREDWRQTLVALDDEAIRDETLAPLFLHRREDELPARSLLSLLVLAMQRRRSTTTGMGRLVGESCRGGVQACLLSGTGNEPAR